MYLFVPSVPSSKLATLAFKKEPHLKVLRETRAKDRDREKGREEEEEGSRGWE